MKRSVLQTGSMRRIHLLVAVILLLMTITGGVVLAQSGNGYGLTWWTVDGGGGEVEGGAYTLAFTTGQPEVGKALIGGGYTLTGGFWPSATVLHSVYLPLVGRGF